MRKKIISKKNIQDISRDLRKILQSTGFSSAYYIISATNASGESELIESGNINVHDKISILNYILAEAKKDLDAIEGKIINQDDDGLRLDFVVTRHTTN